MLLEIVEKGVGLDVWGNWGYLCTYALVDGHMRLRGLTTMGFSGRKEEGVRRIHCRV
jgi:hypothetical protein